MYLVHRVSGDNICMAVVRSWFATCQRGDSPDTCWVLVTCSRGHISVMIVVIVGHWYHIELLQTWDSVYYSQLVFSPTLHMDEKSCSIGKEY